MNNLKKYIHGKYLVIYYLVLLPAAGIPPITLGCSNKGQETKVLDQYVDFRCLIIPPASVKLLSIRKLAMVSEASTMILQSFAKTFNILLATSLTSSIEIELDSIVHNAALSVSSKNVPIFKFSFSTLTSPIHLGLSSLAKCILMNAINQLMINVKKNAMFNSKTDSCIKKYLKLMVKLRCKGTSSIGSFPPLKMSRNF